MRVMMMTSVAHQRRVMDHQRRVLALDLDLVDDQRKAQRRASKVSQTFFYTSQAKKQNCFLQWFLPLATQRSRVWRFEKRIHLSYRTVTGLGDSNPRMEKRLVWPVHLWTANVRCFVPVFVRINLLPFSLFYRFTWKGYQTDHPSVFISSHRFMSQMKKFC